MEEKTLFTLRTARASTEESSENLDSTGHVVAYRFHSSRKKIVNGKVTEITTMNCSVDTGGASWIQQTDKILGTEDIEVSLGYSENTGSEARTATVTFTQEESGEQIDINITTPSELIDNDILVTISRDPYDGLIANIDVSSMYEVASDIDFTALIQYGVSPNDVRDIEITLNKGDSFTSINTPIQKEANPKFLEHDYWPKEDDKYNYIVSFM